MDISAFYSDGARRLKPSAIRKMVHLIDKPGIISLAGSFGVYLVFVKWLATPLPIGLFGF